MARLNRKVLRSHWQHLLPPPQLLLVLLVAGMMARQTGANVECYDQCPSCDHDVDDNNLYSDVWLLTETDGKCPVPEMNAAFNGKLIGCIGADSIVSRARVCARCVRCAMCAKSLLPHYT